MQATWHELTLLSEPRLYSGSLGHCFIHQSGHTFRQAVETPLTNWFTNLCPSGGAVVYSAQTITAYLAHYRDSRQSLLTTKWSKGIEVCGLMCWVKNDSELLSCMIYLKYKKHWITAHPNSLFVLTLQPTKQPLHNNIFWIIQYINESAQMICTFFEILTWHWIKTATTVQDVSVHRSSSAE